MTSHQGATGTSEQATGMRDKTYNLVSVLYHALQGGETCMQYMRDAEHEGDEELVQFFREVQDCQRHLAGRAREMLKQRLERGNGAERGQEQSMGMHQHTSGRSQSSSLEHDTAGAQGTVGPQRQVGTTDRERDEAIEKEGTASHSRR